MAVNKVVINQDGVENVLVDITDSTVTPETLAEGETAYARNGEKIVGAMKPGIDTSDATATADVIAQGRTAYARGQKITGAVTTYRNGVYGPEFKNEFFNSDNTTSPKTISMVAKADKTFMMEKGVTFRIKTGVHNFGDATPEDVAVGKTFTSASGFYVRGTGSTTIDITDDGNGNLTIANAVVTYNNGNLRITT